MLTFFGSDTRASLSRRSFLRVGALGCGGLTMADLLRAEARTNTPKKPKSLIYIVLNGGPSHIDMYDMKPDAPDEYRGPFKPIQSSLTGVQVCELMPWHARIMDRLALLRGVRSVENDHFLSEVYTGLPRTAGKRPAFGSVVSRLAPSPSALPTYVSLDRPTTSEFEYEVPYYVGAGHAPFRPFGSAIDNLTPPKSFDLLEDRKRLLKSFDSMRRDLDKHALDGLDRFQSQAFDMIASPKVREAFDLSRESDKVRASYGKGKYTHQTYKSIVYDFDTRPFLLARRLVEAGVRIVTLRVPEWDHHSSENGDIFFSLKLMLPALDRAFYTLIEDLRARGLEDDVLVVMLGEFGRTPKVAKPGPGREHHADAGCAIFAGGGLQMGQVIGETDSRAERAKTGNISFQNIMASIRK